MQGDGQLNCVERAELAAHRVLADEVARELVVGVQDPKGPEHLPPDIGKEPPAKDAEIGAGKGPGPDLPGEAREHLDGGEPRDEELRAGSSEDGLDLWGAALDVVALDESTRVEEEAGHLEPVRPFV